MIRDRTDWVLVALVFLGGLLAAAQFGKIALTLGEMAEAYARPITDVSFLVSLVGIMGLTLGPMAGGLAAGYGIGRTFLGGLILGGAVSLVEALLPPFGLFAAARVLEGIAHLALVVAGPALMAGAASDRARPLVMGLWAVFFGASLAISAQVFPAIVALGGLPLLFALNGAALLALALLLWRRLPRQPREAVRLDPVDVHRAIYGSIRHMAPGLGFVAYAFLFVAGVAVLPDALGRPGLAILLPLVTLASTLAGGALCRYLAPHHVAGIGYLGSAAGIVALMAGLPLGVEGAFLFMGLIPGACFAAIPAWNADAPARARATGALAQLGNLGTVTGTPVLVYALASGGREAVLVIVGIAAFLGAALSLWSGWRVGRA